uniref:Glucosaminyl (N-acetyl) transferase 1 n=1 Tax=Microcebus murinus TaxID=30608 RepID=A0A8C6EEX0_MICMU
MLKKLLRRRLFSYPTKCCFVVLVFSLVTFSVVRIHQKPEFVSIRHLQLVGESPSSNINCTKVLQGDVDEIQKVKLEMLTVKFRKRTRDCTSFIKRRKYIMEPLSKEEEQFPIAYSLVVHHKIEMLDRLLRAIYMPQNFYCIHVDRKSEESFLAAVKGIASCFSNVFVASQLESVVYASWSRVQADLNCMKDLYGMSARWKYLINLCGMDFPIKTNLEIVRKLKSRCPPIKKKGGKQYAVVNGSSAYFVVSRKNEKSKSSCSVSLATIQRIPEVPGSLSLSHKYDLSDMQAVARFVSGSTTRALPTHLQRHPRALAGDLNWMLRKHHLFANKFDVDVDHFASSLWETLRH